MPTDPMTEPWVLPVARDFVPKDDLKEIPLDKLIQEGFTCHVSFFITHTILTHNHINADKFYLENQFANFLCPIELEIVNANLYKRKTADAMQIPEKLWHAFISNHFIDYHYNVIESDVELLELEFEISLNGSVFEPLKNSFKKYEMSTLPLHLIHEWDYNSAVEESHNGIQIAHESEKRHVTNFWKDFIIIRRDDIRKKLRIAVANDFHYSERNRQIHDQYSDSEDIDNNIRSFQNIIEEHWRKGALDYLVLNGDMIDYYLPIGTGRRQLLYSMSNWLGFEDLIKLFGWSPWWSSSMVRRRTHGLINVPILWNMGDHDRYLFAYPLPVGEEVNVHYNLFGLDFESNSQINDSYVESFPYFFAKSNRACIRYVYERSRKSSWPRMYSFKVGRRNVRIHLADTGPLTTEDLSDPQNSLLTCNGTDEKLQKNLESSIGSDFTVIITHSPLVCLPPDDTRLYAEGNAAPFCPITEGQYGSFKNGRTEILKFLENKVQNSEPVLVISGHVHFKSLYWMENRTTGWTGQAVWNSLYELTNESIDVNQYWQEHPVLLVTTGPVGPRPVTSEPDSFWPNLTPFRRVSGFNLTIVIRNLTRLIEYFRLRRERGHQAIALLCLEENGLTKLTWI